MPTLGKTKVSPSLISTGSLFLGTSSYAVTASYAMNGGGGSGGSTQTGSIANQTILYNVTTSQDNTITGLNLSNNKWGITVVEEWNSGSIVGDEYYNSCSLLLHFSGSNGSTTFIDNSPSPKTVTSVNGASISTAQSKFGGTSGNFDGTDDYLSVTNNSAFDFGAGDFTIEYWEYRTSYGIQQPILSRHANNYAPYMIGWYDPPAGANIALYMSSNGSSFDIASDVSMGVLTTNVWTHYAVTRNGNTFRTFQNGTQISTFTSAATFPAGVGPLEIGRYNGAYYFKGGYIDELRITKGVARYTGSFVTQSAEFLNNASVAQYATKYIGLVGGLNDSTVDYGVEKLSDSSLKIRKMSASGQPLSGSGQLSASVDRVYVNVLNYDNVSISGSISNAISSSYSLTASYNLNSVSSSFANTATSATSASYSLSSSFATNAVTATSATSATSANSASYSLSSSYSTNSTTATSSSFASTSSYNLNSVSSSYSNIANTATSATSANTATSASYSLSSSYSVNSNTSVSSSFASTASYNLNSVSSSFSTTSSYNLNSVSSSYSLTASFSLNGGGGGTTLTTGSTYPITSSWATNSITASYAMNGGGGGSVQTGNIANQTILYNVTTSQDNTITGLNLSSNKWGVTVVEEWNSGSIVGDEYYNSCSLLLHFSGSNGSTTIIDNSPNSFAITSSNGAAISTAQSKFGGSSIFFDGTNDYLSTTHRTNFNVGASDFTIEAWVYTGTISQQVIFGANRDYDGVGACMFNLNYTGKVRFFCSYAGGSFLDYNVGAGTISDSVWHHVAVTRNGSSLRIFIDGIQTGTTNTTLGTAAIDNAIADYRVGSSTDGYLYFNGYIDDLRVTKGVARYTTNFTTSSVAFPNNASLTQLQTKYIGLVGGLNDSTVDYGVEKLSDSSLKIRKMTASGQPLSGSGTLSASVDRVYVNVLDYTNVMVTSSYALTASYVLGGIQTGSISNQTILYNVTTSQDNTITGLDLSGNKWDVSVIEEWNSVSIVGDEYYNSSSLLMHFSGSNGSTTFIDNSPRTKTITANNGAAISTAQSKFGGTSGLFDGTNDYLSIPNNAEFNFVSGTFTVELWAYFSSVSGERVLVSTYQNSTNGWYIELYSSKIYVGFTGNGNDMIGTTTISANTWYHIAVSGTAGSYKLFINGIQDGSTYTGATALSSTAPLYLGTIVISGTGYYYFNGYINELRITNGVARYTGSFVTQSVAFPDNLNVTQLQTKYIGLVGGINDSTVDYGVEKLSDNSLKIRKMSVSGQPLSGSGQLSASVDRVYVNVLNYKEVQTTAQSASYAVSASYLINAASVESFHPFLLG